MIDVSLCTGGDSDFLLYEPATPAAKLFFFGASAQSVLGDSWTASHGWSVKKNLL